MTLTTIVLLRFVLVRFGRFDSQVGGHKMMKEMPALLLLEWEGKGPQGGSRRFVLKILHDGGRGLVELGFYENLARRADSAKAVGEVRATPHTI